MEILSNSVVVPILAICYAVGYVIKKWIPDLDNKFIPTISAVLGVILSSWLNSWTMTPQILIEGLASGLAATGAFEMIRNLNQ